MDSTSSVDTGIEDYKALPFAPVFFYLVLSYSPIVLAGVVWFYKRRHLQPIKARSPILSIVSSIVVLIWQISDVIIDRLFDTIPCVIEVFVEQFMAPFVFSIFICRALWLYATFNHVLQQRLNYQLHSLKAPTTSLVDTVVRLPLRKIPTRHHSLSGSWSIRIWRWENVRKTSFLSAFVIGLGILHTLQFLLISAISPNALSVTALECDLQIASAVEFFVLLIYSGVILLVSRKLRVVIEGLGIKRELRTVGVALLVNKAIWMTGFFVPAIKNFSNTTFPILELFDYLVGIAIQIAVIFIPLYRSWSLEKRSLLKDSADLNTESLGALLQTEEGFTAFYDFVTGELSVENVIFYKSTFDFKVRFEALKTTKTLKKSVRVALECDIYNHALYIFDLHCTRNSSLEVNLPGPVLEAIVERLNVPKNGITPFFLDFKNQEMSESPNNSGTMDFQFDVEPQAGEKRLELRFSENLPPELKEFRNSKIPQYVSVKQLHKFERDVPSLEDLYEPAHELILQLMFRDSFQRFRLSTSFQQLTERFRENRALNGTLEKMRLL